MKQLKAYNVQSDEYGTIVFAHHAVTARREGANELNIEFCEVVSCRREPVLDKYAAIGTGVPWKVLVEEHDWCQECGYCYDRVSNSNPERVWPTDDQVFCSIECYARQENTIRELK